MQKITLITIALLIGAISFWGGTQFANNQKNESIIDSLKQLKLQPSGNILMEETEIRRLHSLFTDYKMNVIKDASLTSKITFNIDVFKFLGAYLLTTKDNVTGIRAVSIRYDQKYSDTTTNSLLLIRGKKVDYQNSIVFLPVVDGRTRFDILDKLNFKKFQTGGYNHGEVCPIACDGDDLEQ